MSGLYLTREQVAENLTRYIGRFDVKVNVDWLVMYDLLCGEYGVLDVIGNAIVDIQDLAHPSEGIKIDQKELIELSKKIRTLIGGER